LVLSGTLLFDLYRTAAPLPCQARNRSAYIERKTGGRWPLNEEATMASSLGGKIRHHRQEKGYSLDRLAELTNSSKSYIWELENRDTRKPSGEKLTKIAEALSVTTDYLLDDSAEPSEEVIKEAFFRKLTKLDPEDRKKIEQLVDMWRKKD
jgi:transcriptional regulator with XRE-family HTH domain